MRDLYPRRWVRTTPAPRRALLPAVRRWVTRLLPARGTGRAMEDRDGRASAWDRRRFWHWAQLNSRRP